MTAAFAALAVLLGPHAPVLPFWVMPRHVQVERASRGVVRLPLIGGPILATPRPISSFETAPHTHAGLVAWAATLRWPWPVIIGCESLRDDSWRPSSASWARGVFQFIPSTWASLGLTGDPAAYSWRFQLAAAERLRARDGLGAWDCARIEGLL